MFFLWCLNCEFFYFFVMCWLLFHNNFLEEEFFFNMKMTDMNFWMILLIIILYYMVNNNMNVFKLSLHFLMLVLMLIMLMSNFFIFYFMYEMVFILIMFVIMMLGYNYERLLASYLMLFYSFLFSSPVLMVFMLIDYLFLMKNWMEYMFMLNYFIMASFMVKFPIFLFHYWLPIAHVEASTMGSMLLAGILLKLGGVGVLYLISYMKFMVKFHWLTFSILIIMLMILNLSDLKMMIAYSSVAHMSMVFYVLMLGSFIGKKGMLIMMFYHGFISPLMFWLIGLLGWWKTRSLFVLKFLTFSMLFVYIIFFLMILNMSFPPLMGFLSEILMLKSLMLNNFILMIMIVSIVLSCYYNIYLFWVFNSMKGWIFKLNIFNLDIYMFMLLSLILNF